MSEFAFGELAQSRGIQLLDNKEAIRDNICAYNNISGMIYCV
jgi:hypothetical protein